MKYNLLDMVSSVPLGIVLDRKQMENLIGEMQSQLEYNKGLGQMMIYRDLDGDLRVAFCCEDVDEDTAANL